MAMGPTPSRGRCGWCDAAWPFPFPCDPRLALRRRTDLSSEGYRSHGKHPAHGYWRVAGARDTGPIARLRDAFIPCWVGRCVPGHSKNQRRSHRLACRMGGRG